LVPLVTVRTLAIRSGVRRGWFANLATVIHSAARSEYLGVREDAQELLARSVTGARLAAATPMYASIGPQ
jgi:hypothetical protein